MIKSQIRTLSTDLQVFKPHPEQPVLPAMAQSASFLGLPFALHTTAASYLPMASQAFTHDPASESDDCAQRMDGPYYSKIHSPQGGIESSIVSSPGMVIDEIIEDDLSPVSFLTYPKTNPTLPSGMITHNTFTPVSMPLGSDILTSSLTHDSSYADILSGAWASTHAATPSYYYALPSQDGSHPLHHHQQQLHPQPQQHQTNPFSTHPHHLSNYNINKSETTVVHMDDVENRTPNTNTDFRLDGLCPIGGAKASKKPRGPSRGRAQPLAKRRRGRIPNPHHTKLECSRCEQVFSRPYNLKQHELTHNSQAERRFACDRGSCIKRFNRLDDLQRHIDTHTGEKRHRCDQLGCLKAFGRREGLRKHLNEVHGVAKLSRKKKNEIEHRLSIQRTDVC